MRTCVVGGGLAGALLAWRLARTATGRVDLVCGATGEGDATAASAGGVRAFEPSAGACRLATDSLRELLDSAVLRRWSGFRPIVFTYLRRAAAGEATARAAEIERLLPGSVEVRPAGDLVAYGWAGLSGDAAAVAVVERRAGYLDPARLRRAVLAELHGRPGVEVLAGPVGRLRRTGRGTVAVTLGGATPAEYDVVVVAAGGWTAALLRSGGLAAGELRTKAIQYAVHPAPEGRPAAFVDETTGLYGRPTDDGGLMLGLPTERWDVTPGPQPWDAALHRQAVAVAARRFPRLRLGPVRWRVAAADCYVPGATLALRPVPGAEQQLFTFTGGSGGSAKTVLAASARAAVTLADPPELAGARQPGAAESSPATGRRSRPGPDEGVSP